VAALVVAWGDAPAVFRALGRFPPVLILPVVVLTITQCKARRASAACAAAWNYALRYLRWNYYLRVLGVVGVSRLASGLVFLSGFAMGRLLGRRVLCRPLGCGGGGLTPAKSGELSKSYWLRELAGPERAP
jgi:hypothetical protein